MTMKMVNLGELNMLYNFQDTITLSEIFESPATYLKKLAILPVLLVDVFREIKVNVLLHFQQMQKQLKVFKNLLQEVLVVPIRTWLLICKSYYQEIKGTNCN